MKHEILEMVDQVKIVERRVEELLKCNGSGVWRAFEITPSKRRSAGVATTEAAGMKRIKDLWTRGFQKLLECERQDRRALNNLGSQEHRI